MIQWFHFLGTEQPKKMKKDATDRARRWEQASIMNDMLSDWLRWNHGILLPFAEADFHSYCSRPKTPPYGRGEAVCPRSICPHTYSERF